MSKQTRDTGTKDGAAPPGQIPGGEMDFLSNPKVVDNYSFLQEIGVFQHIDSLNRELRDSKSLLIGALDIFNRTSVDEITAATVAQISDRFMPSFILFIWKPLQSRQEITVRGYKNYKQVDLGISIDCISPFERFFQRYPKPISFELLAFEIEDNTAILPFDPVQPELVIPILGPSGLYGMILVGHKIIEEGYTQEELLFMQQLMAFVSQAIQNHLHYQQTLRDVKTGLFNHGYFMTRLNDEIARTKRGSYASSIIVIDVDKFKNFNDAYGHLAGDQVLECLAFTLKQEVRTDDVPSRFGGEEFTVLLPNTGREAAWVVAERLRSAVSAMKVSWEQPLPQVTISLGVFTFDKSEKLSATEIIERADAALYLSKERGRNQTTIWASEPLPRVQQENSSGGAEAGGSG
jgi:diguanylate cyclase (GGDEF)-like protein